MIAAVNTDHADQFIHRPGALIERERAVVLSCGGHSDCAGSAASGDPVSA